MKVATAVLITIFTLALVIPAAAQEVPNAINYCASTLSYDLPDGWVAGDASRSQYGSAQRFASVERVLTSGDLVGDERVITLNLIARAFMLPPMDLDADADVAQILEGVAAQAPAAFTVGGVTPITLGDQPAARVDVQSDSTDLLTLALDLDAETLALVTLSAPPDGIASAEAILIDFAESLAFEASRYVSEGDSLSLAQSFGSDDCIVSFGYPAGWTLTVPTQVAGEFYYATLKNFEGGTGESAYTLKAGQVRLDIGIFINTAGEELTFSGVDEAITQRKGFSMISQQETTFAGHTALVSRWRVDDADAGLAGESLQVELLIGSDASVLMALYAPPDELKDWEATLYAIAESLLIDVSNAAE